jgi:hypothetical protein
MPAKADFAWEFPRSCSGYCEIPIVGGEPLIRSVPSLAEILSEVF